MSRRRKKRLGPFEVEITRLGKGGAGEGTAPDGKPVRVRPGPPGARLRVVPMGRKKGTWIARRLARIRPAADGAEPPCAAFGVCGGCTLQELTLPAQRRHKTRAALADIEAAWEQAIPESVTVHPTRGTTDAFGTRNKVELSFGPRRFLREADHQAGHPIEGRWLGFHAPGRFDRVADTERCWLMGEGANALLTTLRRAILEQDTQPLWDARAHTGVWRHALIREGKNTGELLLALFTTSQASADAVERVVQALLSTPLPQGQTLVGVQHAHNDGVADVARGETVRTWGRQTLREELLGISFDLSRESFFQTSTDGARVLYETVGEAVSKGSNAPRGTLLDLYCGTGSIGLVLADRARRIVGVEEVASSIADARSNADRTGVDATYLHAKVEDALDVFDATEDVVAVVDPPRVGLHPSVTRRLSSWQGHTLIYVACKASSLGRDLPTLTQGGWRLTDLWPVDLFPQTGHMEVVARLSR